MICKAQYRGRGNEFGVKFDEAYTITLNTYNQSAYIWVTAKELPDYMMPYSSMDALLRDWDFLYEPGMIARQNVLRERWIASYIPNPEDGPADAAEDPQKGQHVVSLCDACPYEHQCAMCTVDL